jgi:RimJ/RimL family protein N-acetyltransferase
MQLQQGQAHYAPWCTDEYARSLENQFAFTALVGGRPVFVGGVVELWKNRGLVWSFIDRQAGQHFVAIHRAVLRFLDMLPYRRLEAECDVDFAQGHRWLKSLGFQMEAPRMRAFRVDGGDSSLYAKVK